MWVGIPHPPIVTATHFTLPALGNLMGCQCVNQPNYKYHNIMMLGLCYFYPSRTAQSLELTGNADT